jgi:hypothetical protein
VRGEAPAEPGREDRPLGLSSPSSPACIPQQAVMSGRQAVRQPASALGGPVEPQPLDAQHATYPLYTKSHTVLRIGPRSGNGCGRVYQSQETYHLPLDR